MICVNFISLIGWLMLGTASQTMLYYLKQLILGRVQDAHF